MIKDDTEKCHDKHACCDDERKICLIKALLAAFAKKKIIMSRMICIGKFAMSW